jgi:metallo-beta-lactamase family protein
MVASTDDSKALARRRCPMVILSASGMATGEQVLHHLAHYLGDHRNIVILTGYQAPGTRGALLADGAHRVRIHGQDIEIHAEIAQLQAASAHAEASQLIAWLRTTPGTPGQVYVVHGERRASDELRKRIGHELGWRALVPEHGSVWPT